MRAFNIFVVGTFGLGLVASPGAQTVPDAGSLQRQVEPERTPPLPPRGGRPLESETATLTLPDGVSLTVRSFAFVGNSLLRDDQLQPAVQPFRDRPIGFAELQRATAAVADAYRTAGFIVRAFLPQQDVTDGTVTIRVVEARFAGARVEAPAPQRVDPDRLVATVEARQPRGEPLSAPAIDRGLLLADDLPGVAVVGALEPGTQDGETALVLRAADKPLISGDTAIDNAGSRSTGCNRLTLSLRAASPLRRGDQAAADVQKSRGTTYLRLTYSLPVGADGWRVTANVSRFNYRLVGSEFSALNADGNSTGGGLDASYPLLRSRLANLYLQATLDHKRLRNDAQGVRQSDYRVDSAGLALSGNLFDEVGGGGVTSGTVGLLRGRVAQGAPNPGENTALAGGYGKLRWALSRQQQLTPGLSALAAATGQLASKDLDSSERFYLGGPAGVRAYPVNEGSGSSGALLNLELRWRVDPTLLASVFYDLGHVAGKGATTVPAETLKGGGAAIAWSTPPGVDLKLTVARRIGNNPHPTAAGRDQDGSLQRLRAWLQASLGF